MMVSFQGWRFGELWSTPPLPLSLCPFWSGVVGPDSVLSMVQIEQTTKWLVQNCVYVANLIPFNYVQKILSTKCVYRSYCDNTLHADPHYLNHPNYSWPLDSLVFFLISDQGYFTFLYRHATCNIHNREGGRKEEQAITGLG